MPASKANASIRAHSVLTKGDSDEARIWHLTSASAARYGSSSTPRNANRNARFKRRTNSGGSLQQPSPEPARRQLTPVLWPSLWGDPRSAPGLRMNDSTAHHPSPSLPRSEPHFPGTQYLAPHAAARHWPRIRHLPPQAPIAASPSPRGEESPASGPVPGWPLGRQRLAWPSSLPGAGAPPNRRFRTVRT